MDTHAAQHKHAARLYRRTWRQARRDRRVLVHGRLVHPSAPHGTNGGYTNYGCRCDDCTDAHRDARISYQARQAGTGDAA